MSSAPINESHLADMSKQQTDGTIEILTPQMVSEAAKAEDGPKKDSHAAALQSQLSKQQNNDNNSQGPKQQTDGDSITLDQVKVTPKMISEAAKAEGGPTKGSHAAALQSQFSKQQASKNNTSDGPGSQNNTSNGTSSQDSENNSLDGTGSSNNNGAASHNTSASLETRVHSLESTLPFRTVKPVESSSVQTDANTRSQHDKTENFHQVAEKVTTKMRNDPASVTKEDAAHLESAESRALGGVRPPKDSVAAEAKRLATANEKSSAGVSGTAGDTNHDSSKNHNEPTNSSSANAGSDESE